MATKDLKPPLSGDQSSHHSSPTPGDKQTPFPTPPPRNVKKTIGKMPDVPMHVTKHSEPVGRPKNRNYE